jgi:hypothetical protein
MGRPIPTKRTSGKELARHYANTPLRRYSPSPTHRHASSSRRDAEAQNAAEFMGPMRLMRPMCLIRNGTYILHSSYYTLHWGKHSAFCTEELVPHTPPGFNKEKKRYRAGPALLQYSITPHRRHADTGSRIWAASFCLACCFMIQWLM